MAAVLSQWQELMQNSMPSDLPNEIVLDILSRISVKSICWFKCICKPWCTLFDAPKFIKVHLDRAITNNNSSFLLKHQPKSEAQIYSFGGDAKFIKSRKVEISEEIYSLRSCETFEGFGKLEIPFQCKTHYYQIVNSSHGLLCLIELNFRVARIVLNTFLWNPAIREFRAIPKYQSSNFTSPIILVALGFAFHPKINDYKLVRIDYIHDAKIYEFKVYSLSTDSWKKIDANIHGYFHGSLSRAFVNGALHWLGTENEKMNINDHGMILSFDMGEDKFNEMMLPKFGEDEFFLDKSLVTMGESLSLFVYKPRELDKNHDIWVMKEYGVAESWTKQFSIGVEEVMRPLGFLNNGEVIMEKGDRELVLCDLDFKNRKKLQVFRPFRIVKYIERA